MRPARTIFFFLICISLNFLSARKTLGAIVVTPTVTPITAETDNGSILPDYNGVITATPTGGTAPYTYTLIGPLSTTPPQNNPFSPGLDPGAETLLVTDAKVQPASAPLTIPFLYPQPALTVHGIHNFAMI